MPAAGSLLGACRRRKAITLADFLANHAHKMAQLTEGMRVFFDEKGPLYLCVGRDEQYFYFQDENCKQKFLFWLEQQLVRYGIVERRLNSAQPVRSVGMKLKWYFTSTRTDNEFSRYFLSSPYA